MSLAVGKCIGVAGQLLPFHVAYVLAVHLAPLPAVTRLIDVCIYTVCTMRLLARLLFGISISSISSKRMCMNGLRADQLHPFFHRVWVCSVDAHSVYIHSVCIYSNTQCIIYTVLYVV